METPTTKYTYFSIENTVFRINADWTPELHQLILQAGIERVLCKWDTDYSLDGYNFKPMKGSVHNYNPKEE
jgi:hypothetical protein